MTVAGSIAPISDDTSDKVWVLVVSHAALKVPDRQPRRFLGGDLVHGARRVVCVGIAWWAIPLTGRRGTSRLSKPTIGPRRSVVERIGNDRRVIAQLVSRRASRPSAAIIAS